MSNNNAYFLPSPAWDAPQNNPALAMLALFKAGCHSTLVCQIPLLSLIASSQVLRPQGRQPTSGSGGLHGADAKDILKAVPKDGQRLSNLALAHRQRRQKSHGFTRTCTYS